MACEPNSAYVPSSACDPDLVVVPFSSSLLNNTPFDIYSDPDSDDENPPPPASPLALAPPPTSQLPQWVRSTCESVDDLASDPRDQCRTCSQF